MNIEAPSNRNNQPSSVEVLADFEKRRENLAPYVEELEKPGFKQSAEAKIYQKDVEAFNKEWSNYGGEAIDAAQSAVDELNFKSTPEERIAANSALTEARTAFYENYLAQNEATDESVEDLAPVSDTIEETHDETEQQEAPLFAINDIVTIGRNAYDENGAIDRSKPKTLESGWKIESQNADGTYHVILEEGTLNDGRSGRLSKDVTAEELAAWAEESKEKEKTPDAKEAIANFMNAWNNKKYRGEVVAEPVELFPQTENVEKIPVVSLDDEPHKVIVQEIGRNAFASVAQYEDDVFADKMAREKGPSLKEKVAKGIDAIKGFRERRAEAQKEKDDRRTSKRELRARARRIRAARETQERESVINQKQAEREVSNEARVAAALKRAAERKAIVEANADRKYAKIDADTKKEIDGDESSVRTFLRRVGHIATLQDGSLYR